MAKNTKEAAQKPTQEADQFAGIGGSYIIDKDGNKSLVERTAPASETKTNADPE